ncbi:MAG: aldo/keto reductase [Planctomycetota bacterium]
MSNAKPASPESVRWGILGPGLIAQAFAKAVVDGKAGAVIAAASRSLERAQAFVDAHAPGAQALGSYNELLNLPAVDAVYIATPHTSHALWSIRALEAGKAVFCEKPAGLSAAEVDAVISTAGRQGVFWLEAFKERHHPQVAEIARRIEAGELGQITMIQCDFGYCTGRNPESRLWNPQLAGGAILDVGCYPVALCRRLAGAAKQDGSTFDDPTDVAALGTLGPTGVDEAASATLRFQSGLVAQLSTGLRTPNHTRLRVVGDQAVLEAPDPWANDRHQGGTFTLHLHRPGQPSEEIQIDAPITAFAYEARAAAESIAGGELQHPAMSWADSLGNARVLDQWRRGVKLAFPVEKPGAYPPVHGRAPKKKPGAPMTYAQIPGIPGAGVDKPVSHLVMGVDNKLSFAQGAPLWDRWLEVGGNCFDTAWMYANRKMQRCLGQWVQDRGVRDDVVLLSKGAHTPLCTPDHAVSQLHENLEDLKTDRVEFYLLHRDNPDVPVGEFIDALHPLVESGKVGAFGGSNWSLDRVAQASAYAKQHNKTPMTLLSNQLSLAEMVAPVWDGCLAISDRDSLQRTREMGLTNFAWSSGARGYFFRQDGPGLSPHAFDSQANRTRKARAYELAERFDVTPHNVVTAYVLAQAFPSFALIGPRWISELDSTLPALSLKLTPEQVAYLELRRDTPE